MILIMTSSFLSANEEFFAQALVDPTCPSMLEAYRRAGYSTAGTTLTQQSQAYLISRRPHVAARVAELRAQAAAPALADATAVLREWVTIAMADAGEISRVRRFGCRHCYGTDGQYQWIDANEFAAAVLNIVTLNEARAERRGVPPLPFPSFDGGVGYTRNVAPNPECMTCHGDGECDVYIADTDSLSPGARKLYAGVKQTRNGLEILTRDQDGALASIAKYLGMTPERHRHGGDPDNPTPIGTYALPEGADPREAAAIYQAAMAGVKR
jgi:phage terminase small subunit